MSIVATNWALEQRTDGPSAQAVLFIIADRCNERGICRHADPDTIAAKTRQSRATAFRRLEEMERVGLLTRLTRHLKDGRREYEIRCHMDRFVNYEVRKDRTIVLFAFDDENCETPIGEIPPSGVDTTDGAGGSQIETDDPQSQVETDPVSPVRPGGSQSCDLHRTPSKSPRTPQSPPLPDGEEAGQPKEDGEVERKRAGLKLFNDTYPLPSNDPDLRESRWMALDVAEEALALRGARGAKAYRDANPRRPAALRAPENYLGTPALWDEYARFAPQVEPPKPRQSFPLDGPVYRAFALCCVIANRPLPRGRDGTFDFVGEVPSGAEALAALVTQDLLGEIGFSDDWTVVRKGTPPFAAWRDRVAEWTGAAPETRRFWLDDADRIVKKSEDAKRLQSGLPNSCEGLLVPATETGFPPPKGARANDATETET